MAATTLEGIVISHGGLERLLSDLGDTGNPLDTIYLRLRMRVAQASGEPLVAEVHLHSRWALVSHTLEPEDRIRILRAEREADGSWKVKGNSSSIQIFRSGKVASLAWPDLETGRVPDWLRAPGVNKVGGQYRYSNYLCTLRDGLEANLFAAVWENAKPGPGYYDRERKTASNILVVDRSFDSVACQHWSTDRFASYSMQICLTAVGLGCVTDLPFLCVGDVLRAHRVRVASKPPRFINLWQQKYSSIVVFEAPEEGQEPRYSALTFGDHVVTEAEWASVHLLQAWIRRKLENESVSAYLSTVDEILSGELQYRDLVVEVLEVDVEHRQLLVTDRSTEQPVRLQASEPPNAAEWLFSKVKKGHWLKVRSASRAPPGRAEDSSPSDAPAPDFYGNAATMTRMPTWSLDVKQRQSAAPSAGLAARVAAAPSPQRSSGSGARALLEPSSATKETELDEEAEESGKGEESEEARPEALEDKAQAVREAMEEALEAPQEAEEVEEMQQQSPVTAAAASSEVPSRVPGALQGGQGRRARLDTVYGCPSPVPRLRELQKAAEKGERCFIITGFRVAGAFGAEGVATSVDSLVGPRCLTCHHTFSPATTGRNPAAMKRQRRSLPCGHWTFHWEWRGRFQLQDVERPDETLDVFLKDPMGSKLFGVSAEEVSTTSEARQMAQQKLELLLQQESLGPHPGHLLALYRVDGAAAPSGAYVVCDTQIILAEEPPTAS